MGTKPPTEPPLLSDGALELRRRIGEEFEVLPNGGGGIADLRRDCSLQYGLVVIQRDHALRIVAIHGIDPCLVVPASLLWAG